MLELEITRKNVFRTGDKGSERVPVGEKIQVEGDQVPPSLVGKCRVLTPENAEMATGDKPKRRTRQKTTSDE